MKLITFGNCCKKAKQNHQNALTAVQNCGIIAEVINISDYAEMMNYGVMSTPALIIDNKLVAAGRALDVHQIETLIKERQK